MPPLGSVKIGSLLALALESTGLILMPDIDNVDAITSQPEAGLRRHGCAVNPAQRFYRNP
jgi:hypothetical protein